MTVKKIPLQSFGFFYFLLHHAYIPHIRASPTGYVTGVVSKKANSLVRERRKLMLQQVLQLAL
jgi:hypothetical protein